MTGRERLRNVAPEKAGIGEIGRGRVDEDRDGGGEKQPRQQQKGVGEQPPKVDGHVIEDVDAAARK